MPLASVAIRHLIASSKSVVVAGKVIFVDELRTFAGKRECSLVFFFFFKLSFSMG